MGNAALAAVIDREGGGKKKGRKKGEKRGKKGKTRKFQVISDSKISGMTIQKNFV
jgi:hypothetical protein